jgi:hypothetical protein
MARWNDIGEQWNATARTFLKVIADMSSATWNTAASHEVFTVTGLCRLKLWIECGTSLTDAADGASIQFGYEGATNGIIASTTAATAGSGLVTDELWYDTSPTTKMDTYGNCVMDYVLNGLDVGYEITGAALTGGSLNFYCVWEPLESGASVAVGAGGTL